MATVYRLLHPMPLAEHSYIKCDYLQSQEIIIFPVLPGVLFENCRGYKSVPLLFNVSCRFGVDFGPDIEYYVLNAVIHQNLYGGR